MFTTTIVVITSRFILAGLLSDGRDSILVVGILIGSIDTLLTRLESLSMFYYLLYLSTYYV